MVRNSDEFKRAVWDSSEERERVAEMQKMEMRREYEAFLWEGYRLNVDALYSRAAAEGRAVEWRRFVNPMSGRRKPTAAERTEVRQVWARNLEEEFGRILEALETSDFAAMDTEFPGFIYRTDQSATPLERYEDVRRNVDGVKLLQLGLSFFDGDGRRRRTWQINFRDFDISSPSDARWDKSVQLLRRCGLDFSKTRRDGADSAALLALLRRCGWAGRLKPLWVTFQGLYDVAYLLKLLTGSPLPATLRGFARLAGEMLGRVLDVKHMTRDTTVSFLGLSDLSRSLGLASNHDSRHQAGADSLTTAMVFSRVAEYVDVDAQVGTLVGIEEEKIVPRAPEGGRHPLQPEKMRRLHNLPPPVFIPCRCLDCGQPSRPRKPPRHLRYRRGHVIYFFSY